MPFELISAIAIISIAFFFESAFGFGGGLISIPLMSLIFGVKTAVTTVLVFQVLMGIMVAKTFRNIEWNKIILLSIVLIAGTIVGSYMLGMFNENVLRNILAVSILLFLVKNLVFKELAFKATNMPLSASIAGLIGGWFQGIIGAGGPPITMFLSSVIKDKKAFRASIIFVLFVINLIRLPTSYAGGLFTTPILKMSAIVAPFFLIAIFLGHYAHLKIEESTYQKMISALLFVSAIMLFLK